IALAVCLAACGQPTAKTSLTPSPRLNATPTPSPAPTPTLRPSPPNLPPAGGIGVPGGFAAYVYTRGLGTISAMAFGPDGRLYAVNSAGTLLVVPSPGGSPQALVAGLPIALGLAWRDHSLFVSVRGSVREYQLNNGALTGGGAADGIVLYEAAEFGADYAENAFVTEWGANVGGTTGRRVERVVLTGLRGVEHGQVSDFATGFSHPLALTVAPDGGLLVGDYGTGQIIEIFRTS